MPKGREWTTREEAELIRLKLEKLSTVDLMKALGRSKRSIEGRLMRLRAQGRLPRYPYYHRRDRGPNGHVRPPEPPSVTPQQREAILRDWYAKQKETQNG